MSDRHNDHVKPVPPQDLADRINAYWKSLGVDPPAYIDADGHLRSRMVNGVPRGWTPRKVLKAKPPA